MCHTHAGGGRSEAARLIILLTRGPSASPFYMHRAQSLIRFNCCYYFIVTAAFGFVQLSRVVYGYSTTAIVVLVSVLKIIITPPCRANSHLTLLGADDVGPRRQTTTAGKGKAPDKTNIER